MKAQPQFGWWIPPLLALQFLTRIPVPGLTGHSDEIIHQGLKRATIWFPLIGTLIGCMTAAIVVLAEGLWPRIIAVAIALAVEARLTGAIHEDAVADFCDALGGGYDRESRLRILKDSRIGSYGALGLGLGLMLRVATMTALPTSLLVIGIIASACFGRLIAILALRFIPPPPQSLGLAQNVSSQHRWPGLVAMMLLSVPGLAFFAFAAPLAFAAAAGAAILFLLWLRALLMSKLGGATGDCLGFAAYAGQIILLLAAAAQWQ